MSPQALQRIVVRMLWDPTLVERVYAGAPVEGLDAEGRAHLLRVDRRAWDTDPYRRARTLQPLIEEYPCAVAEVGVTGLEAFFAAPTFHQAIMERGSLAVAFGAWIAPRAGPVARIEAAFVALRRVRAAPTPKKGELVRASTVSPVQVPAGTLARWEAIGRALGTPPLPKLLAGFRPTGMPGTGPGEEHLLVQVGAAAEVVIPGAEGVHALLVKAARPVARADLRRVAVRLGATPGEAEEILGELVGEGLLIAG